MNHITISGCLGQDPQIKQVTIKGEEKSVCNYTVAVNSGKNQPPQWFRVATWDRFARNDMEYLKKGSRVIVQGELHGEEYKKKDGSTGFNNNIKNPRVEYLGAAQQQPTGF